MKNDECQGGGKLNKRGLYDHSLPSVVRLVIENDGSRGDAGISSVDVPDLAAMQVGAPRGVSGQQCENMS